MKASASLGLLLALAVGRAAAWNLFGHSVVARIAELEMGGDDKGRAALKKVYATLGSLTKFFPETPDSLLEAAIMPDPLNFNYRKFLDKYHYKDIPTVYRNDDPSLPVGEVEPWNADYALESAIGIIKDSFDPEKEQKKILKKGLMDSLMLRYLLHVTGDVHQPLHAASLYSKHLYNGSIEHGDAGGNLVKIMDPLSIGVGNLHSFWDQGHGLFPTTNDYPYPEKDRVAINSMAEELRLAHPKAYFGDDIFQLNHKVWIQESADLALRVAYSDIDLFPVIRPEYIVMGRKVSRERLTLAGYRLANLLKELFK